MNSIPDDPRPANASTWPAGHPVIDPKHNAAVVFSKPDQAPVDEVREPVIAAAIEALETFAGYVERPVAAALLHHWHGFRGMTPAEVNEVMEHYAAPKPKPDQKSPKPNRRGI